MNPWMVIAVLCYCLKGGLVLAFTLHDEANLQASIFAGYNKDIRAGLDRTFPLKLNLMFYLFSIKEFDFNTGKFSVTGVFILEWIDERLSWDPAAYNQTNVTTIPQNKLWIPDLINVNPYDDITGLRQDHLSVSLQYNGTCSWLAIQSFEVVCNADVTKYPFDTQTCTLNFYVWGYQPHEIDPVILLSKVGLSLYVENGIWEIIDTATYVYLDINNYEQVIVKLVIKRRAPYYVVSLIIPIIAVSFLAAFVFILPHDSGERVGFSTTVLLSIIVYLTIIQDLLPESSQPNISALGYVLVTYVLNGTFTVIKVIISLRLHGQSPENPVPQYLRQIVSCFRRRRKNKDLVVPIDSKAINDEDDNDANENSEVTWVEVLSLFDKLCFIVSMFVFFLTVLIYLCVVMT